MLNAKLPFIIQSTNLIIGINQTADATKTSILLCGEGGKKMSGSAMLISNERPFSWDGGQRRCMMGN